MVFNNPLFFIFLLSLLSAIGLTLAFRIYLENLISGLIVRTVKQIKRGRRIKILIPPLVLKGDVISVGPIRTTLMEVGDGEHLPSIPTGRLLKIPNIMLVNNPLVIYGEVITDEVIAQLKLPFKHLDKALAAMRESIQENGHTPLEIGLYQKDEHLIIHGVFEVSIPHVSDERTKVLKAFLKKIEQLESG